MDIEITGGRIFYTFPFEIPILGKFQITETLVVSWLVMLLITGLCIWLTHDLKVEKISRRQAVAELLVETANKFVIGNMGEKFSYMIPFFRPEGVLSLLKRRLCLFWGYFFTPKNSPERFLFLGSPYFCMNSEMLMPASLG